MTDVVVDASLALKWLVAEEDSGRATALLRSWGRGGRQLVAPHLLAAEVTNALHRKVVQGDLERAKAVRLIERLTALPFELHDSPGLHRRALELAGELGQGASYDCHYLALAEALNCEYWTADDRFHRAARTAYASVRSLSEVDAAG